VFFLVFDENDGLFDHVPPPAPPSYNSEGTMAGKATLDLAGIYFSDPERVYLLPEDTATGTLRASLTRGCLPPRRPRSKPTLSATVSHGSRRGS
jgi:hypothetical protein